LRIWNAEKLIKKKLHGNNATARTLVPNMDGEIFHKHISKFCGTATYASVHVHAHTRK
jgi:hypothetical protein